MAQDKLAELRELLGKLASLIVAAGATLLLVLLLIAFARGMNPGGTAAPAATQPATVAQAGPTATAPAGMAHEAETPAAAPAADPSLIAQGKQLFQSQGCGACHTFKGLSSGAVGPDLTDMAAPAQEYLKDPKYKGQAKDAAGFVRESIVDPNAFIAPQCPAGPCTPGVMPQDFGKRLNKEQIEALVAFLLSQK